MAAIGTFHLFPSLPTELRLRIWALAAEDPRILHVRAEGRLVWTSETELENITVYSSLTPPPAVLHACRESRQNAPYEKSFLTSSPGVAEVRYIWANFQQDMIYLPDAEIHRLEPYGAVIQRLRFTVLPADPALSGGTDELWSHYSDEILEPFTALRELHISIPEPFLQWGSIAEVVSFYPLRQENYAMAYIWFREQGGQVHNMDDIDEELEFHAQSGIWRFNLSKMAEID
ncbi:hypothetical protein SAMD00023353_5200510 [Rosellinia necatrix]|uniref:2EXR domain-containing protein n=1 Tax=Rosellinia necatrix TaxID=77044 RepID=A0A1W2TQK1_ROSNE|nr:hypothetical protein SAMD00023353_5200510 [Rosellinia necatrix]